MRKQNGVLFRVFGINDNLESSCWKHESVATQIVIQTVNTSKNNVDIVLKIGSLDECMHLRGMCILFFASLLGPGDWQTTTSRRRRGGIHDVVYAIIPG